MISVSTSQNLDPRHQLQFQAAHPSSFLEWQAIVTTKVWSPLIWKDGRRGKDHFVGCEYMAIDCDNGKTTLQEAIDWCRDTGVAHIIGTTKSHGKEKISPSGKREPGCDRFRMVLRAETRCESRELYEYNMSLFIEYFHADKSCKDGGRFFYPCKEVLSCGGGRRLEWKSFPEDYVAEENRREIRREIVESRYNKLKHPEWLRNILNGKTVVPVGDRHKTCVYIGAYMSLMKYSPEDITLKLLPTSLGGIGEHDIRRAVTNGWHMEQGRNV